MLLALNFEIPSRTAALCKGWRYRCSRSKLCAYCSRKCNTAVTIFGALLLARKHCNSNRRYDFRIQLWHHLNVRAFNSTHEHIKMPPLQRRHVSTELGCVLVSGSGAFLMLPRDGTTEAQGYASGWKAFNSGTSILVLMGFLSRTSRGSLSVYY